MHVSREESHAGRHILAVLCKYNVTSPKNEINHDIAIKWSQNTKELHKGHELSLFLPSTLNSRRANCSEGLILAYSRYITMIDSVT